jgi:membrane fusion protein, heavy metal efflux system
MTTRKLIFFFVGTLILYSCGNKNATEKEVNPTINENKITLTEAQFKNAKIQLGKAAKRNISTILKLTGKIDVPPQNMVSVSMPLGGFLKSTKLLPGMQIKKGEILAIMEDQQYIQLQQEYLTAKAKLQFSRSEYNRQKELNQSKASSDKIFQQTEMEYENQKVTVSALAEKLRLININPETLNESTLSRTVNLYSTIDGFVSKVNANIGKYVNSSDVLFELINPADIHLNLKVFEKDLDKLSIGQRLVTFTNNQPEKKYPCEIILISQDLSADRSAEVHCHFDNYDKTLLPGMYMNAEVEIKTFNSSCINDDAIVSYKGKEFVFISKGNSQFEMLEVKKGVSEGNFTQISFLNGAYILDYELVTSGAYSLLMQLKNKSED